MNDAPARTIQYRGRFAPSPTGPLHFGSLIAALASFADARAAGGEWLVRIEDVDLPRSRAGAEADILATLARHGFVTDGPVTRQSSRNDLYARAAAQLARRGDIYACTCSRRDLEAARTGSDGERIYPGNCRGRALPPAPGTRHSLRMRVGETTVAFVDALRGPQREDLADEVGDFIVRRADGLYAYQLAVVVDDAQQQITDVVRGADLLSSTGRQILLQRALALPTPTYLHVPIAVNPSGEKLSKQTRACPLPPDPLPTLLAAWQFLGQSAPEATPRTPAEFWAFAQRAWLRERLPPVAMLPAPSAFHAL